MRIKLSTRTLTGGVSKDIDHEVELRADVKLERLIQELLLVAVQTQYDVEKHTVVAMSGLDKMREAMDAAIRAEALMRTMKTHFVGVRKPSAHDLMQAVANGHDYIWGTVFVTDDLEGALATVIDQETEEERFASALDRLVKEFDAGKPIERAIFDSSDWFAALADAVGEYVEEHQL